MRPIPDLAPHIEAARALHARVPVVDAHADIFWRAVETGSDFLSGRNCHQASYHTLAGSGVRVQGASLFTEAALTRESARDFVHTMLDRIDAACAEAPDRVTLARTWPDVAALLTKCDPHTECRIGFLAWLEGGSALMGDFATVDSFIARGLRGVILTHNHACEIADGCGVQSPGGLTAFGRKLIPYLEERGVIVDLSHVPPPGFWDVVTLARKPIAVSHSGNFDALAHPRNLDDDQVRAIADSGGVIGIDFYGGHIATPDFDGRRRASVADVAEAIDRIVRLVGDDHVGLGSDFDGYTPDCVGLETARELPNLTAMLVHLGYDETRLTKILGANWLRLFEACLPGGD